MADTIEAIVIQKIATPAEWATDTRIPYKGEVLLVGDSTGKVVNIKIGDGANTWSNLDYMFDSIQQNVNYYPVNTLALPTPVGGNVFSIVVEGDYTFGGSPAFTVPVGSMGIIYWDGSVWALQQTIAIPMQEGVDQVTKNGIGLPIEKAVYRADVETATKVLNLDTAFLTEPEVVPYDKTGDVFTAILGVNGTYSDKINHKGLSRYFVRSYLSGDATIHIYTISGSSATILASTPVTLSLGVNEFTAAQIGVTDVIEENLVYYVGTQCSIAGQTKYNSNTGYDTLVLNMLGLTVQTINATISTWFERVADGDFVLSEYPKTKEILNKTLNMEPNPSSAPIPSDRSGASLGAAGPNDRVYGEDYLFGNVENPLVSLSIVAKGASRAFIYFVDITTGTPDIKLIVERDCAIGTNTFSVASLGAETIVNSSVNKIHVFCGNVNTQTNNAIHAITVGPTHTFYTIIRATEVLTTTVGTNQFSFFITRMLDNSPLVTEVERLATIVDSGSLTDKKWTSKLGASFGDSITAWDSLPFPATQIEEGQTVVGYQTYIRNYFNCTIDNRGVSGATMLNIVNVVTSYTGFANKDFVTLTSGINDARVGVPIGVVGVINGTYDTSTYLGAMQTAIEHIIETKPTIKIYLIAPINGWFKESGTTNVPGPYNGEMFLSRDYINGMFELAKLYAIPVCNWYDNSFINDKNRTIYIGDKEQYAFYVHPTNAGYKMMGEMIARFMEDY